MDHANMSSGKIQHGSNPSMGMEGHDHKAMIADYKKRFYVGADTYSSNCAAVNNGSKSYWCQLAVYRFILYSFCTILGCFLLWRLALFKRMD